MKLKGLKTKMTTKKNHAAQEQISRNDHHITVETGDDVRRVKLSEFDSFTLALVKLLIGDYQVRRLVTKGMGPRKIENAVLAKSSRQRAPLLVDPYNKGLELLRTIEDGENLLEIDLSERSAVVLFRS